ncbi:amidase signature enzyme [Aaosphaeria arxii CBS 175.79]|uniref:Amidase signature enzyme n=1 Tax=Aaosphaeria arxii CBS 175.79 TaxID=1450172 RepID=A0A6A5XHR1_9PLEO|nr:amidase signature enzyme [Aaosphaeria arxii CBS 175.79]KAF2012805.1 amidase signature enzyme [Aaosphaeria arxii CBS 175.79]
MHIVSTLSVSRQFEFRASGTRYLATLADLPTPLHGLEQHAQVSLVTVIATSHTRDLEDDAWLDKQLDLFRSLKDDVWNPDFLQGLLITTTDQSFSTPSPGLLAKIRSLSSWHVVVPTLTIPTGPYALSPIGLCHVCRLYDDVQNSFMVPTKPAWKNSRSFEPLQVAGSYPQSLSVAVPSRLSGQPTKHSPLKGKRMAVKELFAISGLRMALSNRAFYAVSTPAENTAAAIQSLLDAGATMVGSTKCSSMISREDPIEAVDFQAPWNPRGDGYQSPVGSSNGSATATAAYDWLDFTIGSDTTGSSRRPAFVNGCFQHRFSHTVFSLEGIRPCYTPFDAPAAFTRDLCDLDTIVKVSCANLAPTMHQTPTVIIYPTDCLPVANMEQQKMIQDLVEDLATTFKVAVKKVSFRDSWKANPPVEAEKRSMELYLEKAGLYTFVHDFYHHSEEFRNKYQQMYGHRPFVNKVTQWRWDHGSEISQEQRNDARKRTEVYKSWVIDTILNVIEDTALVVLPIMDAKPNYRDVDPGMPFAQDVWDPLWLSPVLGAPEITVPVGNIGYTLKITKRAESLPVAVSVMSPPGTDTMLYVEYDTL